MISGMCQQQVESRGIAQTISLREEIGFPMADVFPWIGLPYSCSVEAIECSISIPQSVKMNWTNSRNSPLQFMYHFWGFGKRTNWFHCVQQTDSAFLNPVPLCCFFFFTWFKGTCKNKQACVEYFS